MNTIICPHCNKEVEIDKAFEGEIEARVLSSVRSRHEAEINLLKVEQEAAVAKASERAEDLAEKRLAGEKELLLRQVAFDLELEKKRIEQELSIDQRKKEAERLNEIAQLRADSEAAKVESGKLRGELAVLMAEFRKERQAKENAELEAQKKIAAEEARIREEAKKTADDEQRLKLAEKDKQLEAAKVQVEEMQRRLNQGSQQMQGEILELDLENALADAFRDDKIHPVAKGVNGADLSQTVCSASGIECGVILWELKRTKNWTDGWIAKLKTDLRNAKANIPVIVSEILPKQLANDMGHIDGVWVCKPKFAIILGMLLRKSLLDVGRERVVAQNRGNKAEALYNFVTSHEFIQQVEAMVETYQAMTVQVQKERVAYERIWAEREKQARKLLLSTASIVGSMQGHIGQASMPKIKGLELLGDGVDIG